MGFTERAANGLNPAQGFVLGVKAGKQDDYYGVVL